MTSPDRQTPRRTGRSAEELLTLTGGMACLMVAITCFLYATLMPR